MKKKNEKEKYARICPVCKSTKLAIDNSNPFFNRGGIWEYKCTKCGYTNVQTLFPEIKKSKN